MDINRKFELFAFLVIVKMWLLSLTASSLGFHSMKETCHAYVRIDCENLIRVDCLYLYTVHCTGRDACYLCQCMSATYNQLTQDVESMLI